MKTSMIDKNGITQEEEKQVKSIYQDWFEMLLQTPRAESDEQQMQEEVIK